MSKQQTFTDIEYSERKRIGGRDKFLDKMDELVPWAAFVKTVKPFYPESGRRGRQPKEI